MTLFLKSLDYGISIGGGHFFETVDKELLCNTSGAISQDLQTVTPA